jgi:hypothetical protein
VVMVGCGTTKGVLLKFRTPSLVPLKAAGARIPSTKVEVMAAARRRADAKTTPLLRNIFRRILVFIRCLSFPSVFILHFSFCNNYGDVI